MSSGVQGRVVHQLKRAEQAMRAAIDDALAPQGITAAQFGVLAALAAAPGSTSAELARACLVTAQSMHEVIRTLADRDLVDRTRRDGRSSSLAVTPAGHELLQAAGSVVDRVEQRGLGASTDRDQLQNALTALVARLAADTPPRA